MGLCGCEGYRFKLWAAVERCSLKVTGRLHLLKTIWRCFSNIDYMQQRAFVLQERVALKKKYEFFEKGFEYLEDIICER